MLFIFFKRFFRSIYYPIKHGWQFRNIRYHDYNYLIEIIRISLDNFIEEFEEVKRKGIWVHTTIDHDIKNMIICRELCKRLKNNDYYTIFSNKSEKQLEYLWSNAKQIPVENDCTRFEFPERVGLDWSKLRFKKEKELRDYDKELLFKLLNKHIEHWWC